MADQTAICNLALTFLGLEHIQSIEEETKGAVQLKAIWQMVVDGLLAEHDWTWAKQRVALARLAQAPAFGFSYQYQLPADFLRLPKTEEPEDNEWAQTEWRKEGSVLLTEEAAVNLTYIARVEADAFSAKFALALSYHLAASLAMVLTQNVGLAKGLWELALMHLANAKHQDSQERGKKVKTSIWLAARE